jgi:hypothetical protein
MSRSKSLKVPEAMQAKFDEIVAINNAFCKQYLNEEYAELARQMAATLARKRPSPLVNGRAKSWAAGIIYTLGQVNFLFDKSQSPHIRADELCKRIGVSQQTAGGRAKKIRDMLDIFPMHPDWCLPSLVDDNPMIWTLSLNGYMVDVRSMPREVQEIAYQKGLIPYIPADRKMSEE